MRVVAGYSGGADSLVLLAALAALARTHEIELRAVHVNHGLRPEAAAEANLAERVGDALDVLVEVWAVGQEDLKRHRGVGLEEAARRERYLLLALAAQEFGAGILAVGHHQRDQAETVLMHLARGAGLHGAAGMREITPIEVPWWADEPLPMSLSLWRPLLSEPYEEIQRVAGLLRLPVVTDTSNNDRRFRRNAVRLDVLPALETALPGATAGLARFAALAADDDDVLASLADRALREALAGDGLRRDAVRSLPVALRRRVLIRWLDERSPVEPTADRIEAVLGAVDGRSGATIELGQGWSVAIERDVLTIAHR